MVTRGRGRAVIFATGELTEIGVIAAALRNPQQNQNPEGSNADGKKSSLSFLKRFFLKCGRIIGRFLGVTGGTPLERKLSRLFLYIFALAVINAIIVFAANKARLNFLF